MKHRVLAAVMSLFLVTFLAAGCKSSTSSSSGGANTSSAAADSSGSGAAAGSSAAGPSAAGTSCPTSNSTSFAKSKFVLHAGLAFGAFHRYLYKPLQAGTFKSGAHGRITAFVKAGLAALYIKRETRLAYADVKANPTLCKAIAAPLQSVGDSVGAAVSKLKGGDSSGITGLQSTVNSVKSTSASNGATVQENDNAPLK